MRLIKSLYVQVLLAIAAGILLGHFYPQTAIALKPLGDGFIRLIKMMIGPVIFCTLVTGIAGMQDMKQIGRVGLKAVVYFEVLTTIALLLGLGVVNLLKPGAGMHVKTATLDVTALSEQVAKGHVPSSATDFFLHLIPENIIDALANGDMLQILLFSVLFGYGLSRIGPRAAPALAGIRSISHALFAVIHIIMKLAPLGALGAMGFTIGKYGLASLVPLAQLMGSFYLTCLLFVLGVLGGVLWLIRLNIFRLIGYLKEELLIVLGTSSSEAALPGLMEKMEKAGCAKSVVGLVVPTGYSFNLDGTSIYLTMAAVFVAQATDTPLGFGQQLSLLLVLMVASKGAAGVTGSGFITLAAVLPVIGHIPVAGLALILGIDRFMSEARALTNLTGNAVATLVVARWEGELDREKAAEVMGIK